MKANFKFNKIVLITTLTFLSLFACAQQSMEGYYKSIQEFEPSKEFPNGKINPKAAQELKQFDFMLGTSKCTDSVLNRDGTHRVFPSIWKAKYFLNGHAIQDNNFNPVNPTSNLRLYDSKTKTWKVTFLQSANGYFSGVWEGKLEDSGEIVLTKDQNGGTSRLVFYNISEAGYGWRGEQVGDDGTALVTWSKKCEKVN